MWSSLVSIVTCKESTTSLRKNYVRHGVIIYIDVHREYVQDAPHGVVHMTSITVNAEVLL